MPVEAQRQEVQLFRRLNRILLGWYKLVSQALERNRTLTDVTELQSSGDFANKVLLPLVTRACPYNQQICLNRRQGTLLPDRPAASAYHQWELFERCAQQA